jgi:hypothetical protein
MQRLLAGATCTGVLPAPETARAFHFETGGGGELVAAWATAGSTQVALPWRPAARIAQAGATVDAPAGAAVTVTGEVSYFVAP